MRIEREWLEELKEKVESILYNAVGFIGPDGEFLGDYRKLHLRGEERLAFRPGYRMPVFETQFGPIGIMIGWDLAFPEVARSLTLDGADLILVAGSWEASSMEEWRTYTAARACENAVHLAAANRVGEEPSYSFGGGSVLVGPRGRRHTALDDAVEGYAVATVVPGRGAASSRGVAVASVPAADGLPLAGAQILGHGGIKPCTS